MRQHGLDRLPCTVFDGSERREVGQVRKGAARREGRLERMVVWHDLPAGKKNRTESWRRKGTRESEMKTPKEKKRREAGGGGGRICSKGHS